MRKNYNPNLQAMLGNADFVALLTNLQKKTVGPNREPLLEHVNYCSGCADCIRYAVLLKLKKELLDDAEVGGGISNGAALKLRETHTIRYWFPRGDEFRKENGTLDKNVYLFLKTVDGPSGKPFTDPEIFDYFNINRGESQRFKKQQFPDWTDNKEEICIEGSFDAVDYYNKTFCTHKVTRVKRVSY